MYLHTQQLINEIAVDEATRRGHYMALGGNSPAELTFLKADGTSHLPGSTQPKREAHPRTVRLV